MGRLTPRCACGARIDWQGERCVACQGGLCDDTGRVRLLPERGCYRIMVDGLRARLRGSVRAALREAEASGARPPWRGITLGAAAFAALYVLAWALTGDPP